MLYGLVKHHCNHDWVAAWIHAHMGGLTSTLIMHSVIMHQRIHWLLLWYCHPADKHGCMPYYVHIDGIKFHHQIAEAQHTALQWQVKAVPPA